LKSRDDAVELTAGVLCETDGDELAVRLLNDRAKAAVMRAEASGLGDAATAVGRVARQEPEAREQVPRGDAARDDDLAVRLDQHVPRLDVGEREGRDDFAAGAERRIELAGGECATAGHRPDKEDRNDVMKAECRSCRHLRSFPPRFASRQDGFRAPTQILVAVPAEAMYASPRMGGPRTGRHARCALAFLALLAACTQPPRPPDGVMPAGDFTVSLRHEGRDRRYLVHVPTHGDPRAPRPLVLVLHGAADDAVDNRDWLGLDALADREGFLAVYPDGTGPFSGRIHMWNSGDCCGSAQWSGVDDVGFLLAVLDDVSERTAVDATRVYATGLSNGAMMAYRLADMYVGGHYVCPRCGTRSEDGHADDCPWHH